MVNVVHVLQVGSGAQILCTAVVTLLLAAAGFLSPAARGSLLTAAIVLYPLLAITAGFTAVVFWSSMQCSHAGGTSVCLKTACFFPGMHQKLNCRTCYLLHRLD
jgi:transmembrane 9 superfamily member 2/4